MSDPKSSYGDPVDEPTESARDTDVVGRAHEGLAEAEAARRDVPETDDAASRVDGTHSAENPVDTPAAHAAEPVVVDRDPERPVVHRADDAEPVDADGTVVHERVTTDDDEDERWARYAASADPEPRVDDTPTVAAATAGGAGAAAATTARDDAASAPTAAYGGAQPIFVQAPEAPRPRGNRGTAGAIGLLAAVVFAVLYLAATLGLALLTGDVQVSGLADAALAALQTWSLWVPVVVFFIGFWFLGAIINRGRWGHWVVWGLLVGVAAYAGHLLGQLFQAPFWMLTAREGSQLLQEQALAPLAIVAFVLGRELTIWFGAWVAARGRRVTELNDEAQREYERTLEAGPQLHRA
ncbi:ABC transporter [Microbacterium sp. 10M-3C3]|uniref:ABC transporter n=1 Tax=Microbacterium sp. 10M-3C3 TaxID=2483401 RepID=UPI000F63124E|nr:ABC transporter [Microbacterium sp. 10M-3C3]